MEPSLGGTEVHSIAVYAMLAIIMILIGIVGYFLSKVLEKVDKTSENITRIDIEFKAAERRWEYNMGELKIYQRDHESLWRNIDILKTKLGISVDATRTQI